MPYYVAQAIEVLWQPALLVGNYFLLVYVHCARSTVESTMSCMLTTYAIHDCTYRPAVVTEVMHANRLNFILCHN